MASNLVKNNFKNLVDKRENIKDGRIDQPDYKLYLTNEILYKKNKCGYAQPSLF